MTIISLKDHQKTPAAIQARFFTEELTPLDLKKNVKAGYYRTKFNGKSYVLCAPTVQMDWLPFSFGAQYATSGVMALLEPFYEKNEYQWMGVNLDDYIEGNTIRYDYMKSIFEFDGLMQSKMWTAPPVFVIELIERLSEANIAVDDELSIRRIMKTAYQDFDKITQEATEYLEKMGNILDLTKDSR